MSRIEPPPIATWMLEHLTPADCDEALAGDLLEVYRSGRSSGWFWRQVLVVCVIAWIRSLRPRVPLLIFALLWSALAPSWIVLFEGIENHSATAAVLRTHWPLAAALWTVLNAVFLWSGMLVYFAARANSRSALHASVIGGAFLLAPAIFLPAYLTAFVVTNLLWYPGLGGFHALTPLAEIVDLRVWADTLRVPYIVALASALWTAEPRTRRVRPAQLAESLAVEFSTDAGSVPLASTLDPVAPGRFLTLTVAAGLINAMIASLLLARLPGMHAPGLAALCVRAMVDVLAGVLAGVAGSWFYWSYLASAFRENPPLPFSLFALVCASGWVWIPSMVLFSEQVSAATALAAVVGAAMLASGLRGATGTLFAPTSHTRSLWEYNHTELFAESLDQPRFDIRGYGIAVALYAAGWALAKHSNYTAALLLAFSAFLFVWERTEPRDFACQHHSEYRRSARRLTGVALPAVLLTMWALLDGTRTRSHGFAVQNETPPTSASATQSRNHTNSTMGLSGYESIILWPVPQKREIAAPLPPGLSPLDKGAKRPLLFRFTGAYWYFQPPEQRPGAKAHQAHGTPLDVNIHTNNSFPLIMEAHQNLSSSIDVLHCREIDVTIENREREPGALTLALLLGDSASPKGAALYLGQQPVVTSEPGQFPAGLTATHETLRFFVPSYAKVQKFDEIKLLFLPDLGPMQTGPKIAVEGFAIVPR